MKGILTLIPTPIAEDRPLNTESFNLLNKGIQTNALFVFEDPKPARRRWVKWGLPREQIDQFMYLNEHNFQDQGQNLLDLLLQGKSIYLMSDCGLPCFMDPGTHLVDLCHLKNIPVTSAPFENSFILSLILSGFSTNRFYFAGYPTKKNPERKDFLKNLWEQKETVILFDTPYRLTNLLKDIIESEKKDNKEVFLAINLQKSDERILRGKIRKILAIVEKENIKGEFVLVLSEKGR